MADFYTRMAETAVRLITKYGRDIVIGYESKTGPDYDPVISYSDVTVKAVQDYYSAGEVDGSLVTSDDIKFMLIADVAPQTKDVIRDDGKTLQIINVKPLKPGPTNLYYLVQARV